MIATIFLSLRPIVSEAIFLIYNTPTSYIRVKQERLFRGLKLRNLEKMKYQEKDGKEDLFE